MCLSGTERGMPANRRADAARAPWRLEWLWHNRPVPARMDRGRSRIFKRRPTIKFLRMKPGFGEVLLAEGDPRLREDEERLVEEFRRQLDEGMWAAVPTVSEGSGRREAQMVRDFAEIPTDAERVIFFPRAAGG